MKQLRIDEKTHHKLKMYVAQENFKSFSEAIRYLLVKANGAEEKHLV